ncbi:tripartite tricarboxylate transporter substrate binding protein [Roseomonas aerophila]|uniref:Tripartite tricarboxylate transporter substrate binding protein n=1 Tax=Teichococcus aerophilus TaxID=1224513 RepID=A0ABR7RG48_9PROT|nr:tripartite tricarboxylate transporter substrate binding protein [Pseudoroseomonas aerophila]MBC9205376.1 tripartite tricarboxylate transporter substrate binding protein [Pseudoroseomonas aerophila]
MPRSPTLRLPRRTLLATAPALLALPALVRPAAAQAAWPTRPVRMVVPFAAGGATDLSSRVVAQKLSELLGQPIVIENRPGAGGTLGVDNIAKSAPDGYSFAISGLSTTALAMGLYKNLSYDPVKDLMPVAPTVLAPIGIVVRKGLGVSTLQEFIALLKSKPGQLTYGSAGNGASGHISCVALLQQTGTSAVHVPYRGSGPVFNDLLAGVIDFTADVPGLMKPHVESGALVPLVMATEQRSSILPNVPTSAEAGLPGYKAYSWFGIFAPAGTPQPIIDKLAQATETTLTDPAIASRLENEVGLPPMPGYTPAKFAVFLRQEIDYWVPLVKASGASAD